MDKLIRVEDWESGKIKLTDSFFDAVFEFPPTEFARRMCLPCTLYFEGRETGTRLHKEFHEVLTKFR